MIDSKIDIFLKEHGLDVGAIDVLQILNDFRSEMGRGLRGEGGSLKMLPSFISLDKPLVLDKPVIVIDAGGTNLRVALLAFKSSGEVDIEYLETYSMPGVESEISSEDFFAKLAEYLSPVIDRSDHIGFCFSYPAEILPNGDGKLLHWTKEIKAPDVVGEFIGAGLLHALGVKGKGKGVVLLNDTIATLLAGKTLESRGGYSSYVGFILGTGTNSAYVESNANILKYPDLDASLRQAVNVESGNFSLIQQSNLDRAFDAKTANPGSQKFEKMISGLYRGELILRVLKEAADDALFGDFAVQYIRSLSDLTAYDVDMFLLSKENSPLMNSSLSSIDRTMIKELINGVYRRCAKFAALNISATVLQSGAGATANHPVCVNIDGSTYYKSIGFKELTEEYLREILGSRGIAYETIKLDDSPLLGAAVAGLTFLNN